MADSSRPARSTIEVLRKSMAGVSLVQLRDLPEPHGTPMVRPEPQSMGTHGGGAGDGTGALPERVGPYQLFGEIARGGMGRIIKARDLDLGRDVAMKVLLDEHRDRTEIVQRFVEEAQIGSQMQHPGIIPVHGMGLMPSGAPYFTMKLVKGRTLAALLEDRQEPVADRLRLLGIFEQVCQTLAYAHARQVIHRDLKPSNIMIGAFGEVQVMDWGLAKVLTQKGEVVENRTKLERTRLSIIETLRSGAPGSDSLVGSILGTPAYMSPEQARGELDDVDARSDVFGLGAILCEILTGRPPYDGESLASVQRQARKGYLEEAVSRLDASGADSAVVALAKRCLAFEQRERPAHAGEVATVLHEHLGVLEEHTRSLSVEAAAARIRAKELNRTRRLAGLLAAGIALVLLVAGGSAFVLERDRSAQASRLREVVRDRLGEASIRLGRARGGSGVDLAAWDAALASSRALEGIAADLADPALSQEARAVSAQINAEAERARIESDRVERNRRITSRLDAISGGRSVGSSREVGLAYQRAFRELGIDVESLSREDAARAIQESGIAPALASALDSWSAWRREFYGSASASWKELVEVAIAADPEPLRARIRRAAAGDDASELRQLGITVDPGAVSLDTLSRLVERLNALGGAGGSLARSLIERAWRARPGELRTNVRMADSHDVGYDDARVYRTAAAAAAPRYAMALADLAELLSFQGQNAEALHWIGQARRLTPEDPRVLGITAVTFSHDNRTDQAILAYREALRLEPTSAVYTNNLGVSLSDSNDFLGALRVFQDAVRLDPGNGTALMNIGLSLEAAGNLDGAITYWREAVRKGNIGDSWASLCHRRIASILRSRRDWEAAAYHLRESIRSWTPDAPKARIELGRIAVDRGDAAGALAEFAEALIADPSTDNTEIHTFLLQERPKTAFTPEVMQSLSRLIETCEQLLASGGAVRDDLSSLLALAIGWKVEAATPEAALELARSALRQLGTQSSEALGLMAQAYVRGSDHRRALLSLEQASELGDFPPHLARLLEEERSKALPDLPTCATIDAALEKPRPLILEGDAWRYFPGRNEPARGLEWTRLDFDDRAWQEGPSGFGFDDGDDRTILADMRGQYTTVYIRKRFTIDDPTAEAALRLSVRSDDGFVAYVNGIEVAPRIRAPLGIGPLPHDATATVALGEAETDVITIHRELIHPGENLLAIHGLNESLRSSDFTLIPELFAEIRTDPQADRQRFARFRGTVPPADARLAYLDGRVAQRAGDFAGALGRFQAAHAADPREPWILLRLIECLEATGKKAEILQALRAGLRGGVRASALLLERWISAEQVAGTSVASLLHNWPRRAVPYKWHFVPSAEEVAVEWRKTFESPGEGWEKPDFRDAEWELADGAFGGGDTKSPAIRTPWTTKDIWIRKEFEAAAFNRENPKLRVSLYARVCHDDDAEVYINGAKAAVFPEWSHLLWIERRVPDVNLLRNGANVLAAHCRNGAGALYLDVDLYAIIEPYEEE